ncbi:hypothetical protein PSMK_03440 [Phycisphaera mikurensis NBRC 102666]|uniref:Uncharacterized protein n=1 Tax=Phycisphaera mikurensis (strain NBRC 102666 / KCTC 22515 / FYK2301M01) TaxID=1142394 RepID=I0IB65_PHYMF|nr:hypothetical protein PSMK_03440 [Phycisphaera mikurensis NBRC 102666]
MNPLRSDLPNRIGTGRPALQRSGASGFHAEPGLRPRGAPHLG